jgi:hypothetical protein
MAGGGGRKDKQRPKVHSPSHSITGVRTRSSLKLRAASKIQAQPLLTHRSLHREGKNTRTQTAADNPFTQVRQLALLPQRSSLRCALRESLDLSGQGAHLRKTSLRDSRVSTVSPSTQTSDRLESAHTTTQAPVQESNKRTRDGANATHSLEIGYSWSSGSRPQRSSIRRALRASLEAIDAGREKLVRPPENLEPKLLQTLSQSPVDELKPEPRSEIVKTRDNGRHQLSTYSQGEAVPPAKPQRSSLRRAIRESLYAAADRSAHLYTALVAEVEATEMSSRPHIGLENDETGFLAIPDGEHGINSSSESLLATSSNSSSTPLKVLTPESSPESPAQRAEALLSMSASATCYSSAMYLSCKSDSGANVARHQAPILALEDRSTGNNDKFSERSSDSQTTLVHKSWHRVHEIVNDAPGGLYLVDWEGRDPRTGVMVSII